MSDESQSGTRLAEALGELTQKALRANLQLIQSGIQTLENSTPAQVLTGKRKGPAAQNLESTLARLAGVNIEHMGKLVDLTVSYARAVLEVAAKPSSVRAEDVGASARPTAIDLQFKGTPGETCRSGFVIENNKRDDVHTTFEVSTFTSPEGGTTLKPKLRFKPPEVTLRPGESARVMVELILPANAAPGTYLARVGVEGFPEMAFRLVVIVGERSKATGSKQSVPGK